MEEQLIFHERVRLSFGSFIIFMAIAGFSIALISVIFQTLSSFWWLFAGDPSITIGKVAKPFLSLLIDPFAGRGPRAGISDIF